MRQHDQELAIGRVIPSGAVTPYLCLNNHMFLVVGPHIWCTCGRSKGDNAPGHIWQMRDGHCGCMGERYGRHEHDDGTEGHAYSDAVRRWCSCNTVTKGLSRSVPRSQLRAASAAFLIGGYHAARTVLSRWCYAYPPHAEASYGHPLPTSFPAGR